MRLSFLLIAACVVSASAATAAEQPNIVLIFVDDLGYGDPGCYGGKAIPTPNIDRLAAQGVRFTDGYVTAPVCGPSRVGLLAKKYGLRLPNGHKLLPQALEAGKP
ncbi:MAG: sulfatase family protein [Planctomycetota bacterium]|jgi:hypothetical protein